MLKDIEQVKVKTRHSEVILIYNDCRSDIKNQCDRSQKYLIKKNEKNLFLNHIYSESFVTVLKQYMISFV